MSPPFTVLISSHFDRLFRGLHRQHDAEVAARLDEAVSILSTDPTNRTGTQDILKLRGVNTGKGRWRLRLGRFRFLYDVEETVVRLKYCGLRREDTYR